MIMTGSWGALALALNMSNRIAKIVNIMDSFQTVSYSHAGLLSVRKHTVLRNRCKDHLRLG